MTGKVMWQQMMVGGDREVREKMHDVRWKPTFPRTVYLEFAKSDDGAKLPTDTREVIDAGSQVNYTMFLPLDHSHNIKKAMPSRSPYHKKDGEALYMPLLASIRTFLVRIERMRV